jgi:hypothetical protein
MNKHNFKGYEGPDCACCSGKKIKLEVSDLTDPVFDRGFDAGVLVERSRIVNLLHKLNVDSFDDIAYKHELIALIKGEDIGV